ncbi:MAG: hypothetical protein JWQ21_629 [Herminiimonas sp.]|nr:hypothetical protein [Herminiimonas sp.]
MRPRDAELHERLTNGLISFSRDNYELRGIADEASFAVLLEQILESIHRIQYIGVIEGRNISPNRSNPASNLFDPERAAMLMKAGGQTEEACWLLFLSVYFGKNPRGGWRYAREVYGRLGAQPHWTWDQISCQPNIFREWIGANHHVLRRADVPGGFGNHRKYESLGRTGEAIESYVNWVMPHGSHQALVQSAIARLGTNDPRLLFDYFYRSIRASVISFGRTAAFDFLTMLGKLDLAPIEPGSTYMGGATGPLQGARLLFANDRSANLSRRVLDARLVELGAHLDIGMQPIEDALCNWQKNPRDFVRFRG